MSKKISGAEYNLGKIFSSDFEYQIPSYQRPYSWTVEQASELFDDLFDFYKTIQPDESYFLGSIVLIKEEDKPRSEVIDGQQRLTTLTILLAVICSLKGKDEEIKAHIVEPGKKYQNLESKPRLTLRERDKEFFQRYVQDINFGELLEINSANLKNESQENIQKNSKYFLDVLNDKQEELDEFIKFLVNRCFLVVVSTPTQESAFRIFSVMNTRGLDLQLTDIIKADTIGKIDVDKQDKFNKCWEDMEVELGRSRFNDLFQFIRMIYVKEKAKKSLLEEFRDYVLKEETDLEKFIEKVLKPYSSSLFTIVHCDYQTSKDDTKKKINDYLYWLNRIDNSDWIPVAILFLSKQKNNPEYVYWFFKKLERLAAYLHVCGKYINERIVRYKKVILELEKEHNMDNPPQSIELDGQEANAMKSVLTGNIYELTARRRSYIILRLDSFMVDAGARYDNTIFTIEHVLPKTVNENSDWHRLWPDVEKRQNWVDKLANLVPLNRKRNSKAYNYDFEKKKQSYFQGSKEVTSYALTSQVLNTTEWTEEHLIKRQEDLLKVFSSNWELDINE